MPPFLHHDVANIFKGKSVLVTGGTGSFGKQFVGTVLERYDVRRLIVFSRDEQKHFEMEQQFSDRNFPAVRYFIEDDDGQADFDSAEGYDADIEILNAVAERLGRNDLVIDLLWG